MDDLIQRNIQDVLDAVQQDEQGLSLENTPGSTRLGTLTQSGSLRGVRRTSMDTGSRPISSRPGPVRARQSNVDGAGGAGGTGLDIPGNLEASLRLHKARIRGLEDDASKAACSAAEKERQLAEAMKEVKALRAEKAAWSAKQKALEGQAEKHRRAAEEASGALAAREAALKEASKDSVRGEKERRAQEAEVRAREVRLQRALEEVERYRALLHDAKSQERDGKDSAKSDSGRLLAENKKLERQRAELLVAFKKQLKLIDVLKRQKTHLEAARALQFTEEEFIKTLDMGGS